MFVLCVCVCVCVRVYVCVYTLAGGTGHDLEPYKRNVDIMFHTLSLMYRSMHGMFIEHLNGLMAQTSFQ